MRNTKCSWLSFLLMLLALSAEAQREGPREVYVADRPINVEGRVVERDTGPRNGRGGPDGGRERSSARSPGARSSRPAQPRTPVTIGGRKFAITNKTKAALEEYLSQQTNVQIGRFMSFVASIFGLVNIASSPPDVAITIATGDEQTIETLLTAPATWDDAMKTQARSFIDAQLYEAHKDHDREARALWETMRDMIENPHRYNSHSIKFDAATRKVVIPPPPGESLRGQIWHTQPLTSADREALAAFLLPARADYCCNDERAYWLSLSDLVFDLGDKNTPIQSPLSKREFYLLHNYFKSLLPHQEKEIEQMLDSKIRDPRCTRQLWEDLRSILYVWHFHARDHEEGMLTHVEKMRMIRNLQP